MDYSKIRATWWSGTLYHKEQLDLLIANTDIKNYAYILHDKDKQDEGEELKKAHYHFLVQLQQKQRGAWFKQFSTDDMGIVFAQPCYAPKGAFDYLIHDTPIARKQNKHLYDASERISTIDNFEADEKFDENGELHLDLLDVLDGKLTWHDFIQKKPKRIHMISNIKVAYDMLYFERHGARYFDTNPRRLPPPKTLPPLSPASPKDAEGLPW